jgi:hypothetical protein
MGDVYKTILFVADYFDNVSLSYINETMGIVAIWKEQREISNLFATIEEISRCEFARFKIELAPTIPIAALTEIGNRMDALKAV